MARNELIVESASITDRGLSNKTPENQDSVLELPEDRIFAVADGVGGAQAGEVASQMAVEILCEAFTNFEGSGDVEQRMKLALETANTAIHQMSSDLRQLSSMATTIAAFRINRDTATIAHVGDSRIYRLAANGELIRETDDHSLVEEEVSAGRLTQAQAKNHPQRNIISRALGAGEYVEVDLKTIEIQPGETILACSDGVTRHIPDTELQVILLSRMTSIEICESIKKICFERGAEDNLSAVVVRIFETPDSIDGSNGAREEAPQNTAITDAGNSDSVESDVGNDDSVESDVGSDDSVESDVGSDDSVELGNIDQNTKANSENPTRLDNRVSVPTSISESHPFSIFGGGTGNIDGSKQEGAKDVFVDRTKTDARRGHGTLLRWILYGLLVAMVAVGGFYNGYLFRSQQLDENSLKINVSDVTEFDRDRISADSHPGRYIFQNSVFPVDAGDFFLLGRAHFLQRNYDSAEKSFERAISLISKDTDPQQTRIIQIEIPIMMAIIQNKAARISNERGIDGIRNPDGDSESRQNQNIVEDPY